VPDKRTITKDCQYNNIAQRPSQSYIENTSAKMFAQLPVQTWGH
jgi:hypothetical protein